MRCRQCWRPCGTHRGRQRGSEAVMDMSSVAAALEDVAADDAVVEPPVLVKQLLDFLKGMQGPECLFCRSIDVSGDLPVCADCSDSVDDVGV
eukprot:COSAG02_NODE_5633_length_4170_cov_2.964628_3_plen_92_part_00